MSNLNKIDEQWIPLQSTVFARWVTDHLGDKRKEPIQDLTKDLSDGVTLVELAEQLTHKSAANHYAEQPKYDYDKTTNCDTAIDMFQKDGVRFVGISGKDVSDQNQKLILGLVWTLILHYSIDHVLSGDNKVNGESQTSQKDQQKELVSWASERITEYPNIDNFAPYDLSMCALLDSYYPEKVNYHDLDVNDHESNAQIACDVMKEVGIPVYVYPEDLEKNNDMVDGKTLAVQLAAAKEVLESKSILQTESTAETDDQNDTVTDAYVAENDINIDDAIPEVLGDAGTERQVQVEKDIEDSGDAKVKHLKVHVGIQNEHKVGHKKHLRIHVKRNDGDIRVGDIEQNSPSKTTFTLLTTENDDPVKLEGQDVLVRVKRHGKITEKLVHAGYKGVQIVVNNHTDYEEKVQVIPENGERKSIDSSEDKNHDPKVQINYDFTEEKLSSTPVDVESEQAVEVQTKDVQLGDNAAYSGRKFALVMKLKGSDYNNGNLVNGVDNADGPEVVLALSHIPNTEHFINEAGQKLDLQPLRDGDDYQQFVFGENEWNTVIDSVHQRGMVWDVCDQFNLDPPEGTPYYLFPFHGRHNQHFVFQNNHIYATQNGEVVTYVGGDIPFVMMEPKEELKARQTFYIQLL